MSKYFIVKAKCGHVGKSMFIPMNFAIYAENGKEAASVTRKMPGVKRDHPDAILSVTEITLEEYNTAKQLSKNDPYWQKENMGIKSNQIMFFPRLMFETRRNTEKTNKRESRKFRYRRASQYERSLCNDIAREYGLVV